MFNFHVANISARGGAVSSLAKIPEDFRTSSQAIGILLLILVKQIKSLEFSEKIHKHLGILSQQLTYQLLHSSHINGAQVFGAFADLK